MTFDEFFKQATGTRHPYPYQSRFATGTMLPQLLSVPTGVGKTATAVLGWLWRRRFGEKVIKAATPRRLVYCLPMRTLVEQTQSECQKWLQALGDEVSDISVHLLMGGEDASDWDEHPERDAIIIGTQDMLLSRALNRGYGMSRYRWPLHFGLLNNDCQWILDETQLMGVGLTTSAQLAGLRDKLGRCGVTHTLWMSATLGNDQLATVDHPQPKAGWECQSLTDRDRASESVQRLLTAQKPVGRAATILTPDNVKNGVARKSCQPSVSPGKKLAIDEPSTAPTLRTVWEGRPYRREAMPQEWFKGYLRSNSQWGRCHSTPEKRDRTRCCSAYTRPMGLTTIKATR